MSGLIKRAAAGRAVAALPPRPHPLAVVSAPPPDPRIDALEEDAAALRAALTATQADTERAVAAARKAGREEAEADDAERTEALAAGIAEAVAAWRGRLAATDTLAAGLARIALERMFAESADLADLVCRTIARHLTTVAEHTLVAIRVSAANFADPALLAEAAGPCRVQVVLDPALPAGACRITLRLGQLDLDPPAQWAVFDAALRELEAGR